MADERMITLLRQRSVRCTLRKSPPDISQWFYDTLKLYSILWVRPDKGTQPIKGVLDDAYSLLRFVALPNNVERKRDLIETRWPPLRERFNTI